jgi:hypothetical protein
MTTKLDGPLKREVEVDGAAYTLTITPLGLKLAAKGHRRGHEFAWSSLVSGDAALAAALNASIRNGPQATRVQSTAVRNETKTVRDTARRRKTAG